MIENKDNFKYRMDQFVVEMRYGILYIDGVGYEEDEYDPTYTFARELWKVRGYGQYGKGEG